MTPLGQMRVNQANHDNLKQVCMSENVVYAYFFSYFSQEVYRHYSLRQHVDLVKSGDTIMLGLYYAHNYLKY